MLYMIIVCIYGHFKQYISLMHSFKITVTKKQDVLISKAHILTSQHQNQYQEGTQDGYGNNREWEFLLSTQPSHVLLLAACGVGGRNLFHGSA